MRKVLLLATSFAVLTGCQTLDVRPEATNTEAMAAVPVAPEAKWVELGPEALPATDWVAEFSDPVLLSLVNEALAANTDIRSAAAAYEAALARADIAAADLLPSVNGDVSASRREFGDDRLSGASSFGLGVNASWEADVWGRVRDQADAGKLDAAASQADLAGVRLAIAAQVTQTWFNLIEAKLLQRLTESDVETQARALRLTERRFDGGVAESSDVRLARSAVASAEALLALRKQTVSATERSLEILLRRYPAEALTAPDDLPPLPGLSGVGTPANMLVRRPDLLAADRRLQSAGLDVDVARKALLPSLNISGGVNGDGSSLENLFDVDSLVASLLGSLTQPIFQGGRLKANVKQQEAFLRQQAEGYAGTVLTAYLEVENALDAEARLREREEALRISVDEALQAEDRLEARYSEGLASILQLLDAQSRRISAEGQLISARKERLANRVRLYVALGGGQYGDTTFLTADNVTQSVAP